MSTKHGLDGEGAVVCGATAWRDGSNTASNVDLVTCLGCRDVVRWFINEDGAVYDYYLVVQERDYPGDDHTAYATKAEAEIAAAHLTDPDPAGGAPVPQMAYDEAISYAIFAINTLQHPDASGDADVARLDLHADEILASLVDLRETVQGLP